MAAECRRARAQAGAAGRSGAAGGEGGEAGSAAEEPAVAPTELRQEQAEPSEELEGSQVAQISPGWQAPSSQADPATAKARNGALHKPQQRCSEQVFNVKGRSVAEASGAPEGTKQPWSGGAPPNSPPQLQRPSKTAGRMQEAWKHHSEEVQEEALGCAIISSSSILSAASSLALYQATQGGRPGRGGRRRKRRRRPCGSKGNESGCPGTGR